MFEDDNEQRIPEKISRHAGKRGQAAEGESPYTPPRLFLGGGAFGAIPCSE